MKIKVGVIFGGNSTEHEVSIISATQAMQNINTDKYDIYPIYIDKDGQWYSGKMLMDINVFKDFDSLKKYANKIQITKRAGIVYLQRINFFKNLITDIDIFFPIVHGKNVEDGTIQGFLETIGAPYVGSGVLGSALGQDKVVMKQLFEQNNLPVVPYLWYYEEEYFENKEDILVDVKKLGFPLMIKPATLGSSIGISKVKKEEELDEAVSEAFKYDNKVVIEKEIENLMEINCSVFGNYINQETSSLEQVMGIDEFLSYRDKYMGGKKGSTKGMVSTNRIIPADISEKLKKEIEDYAVESFKVLNLSGVARIDFLVDKKKKKVYINEPNTIPGSLSYYLWNDKGVKYRELIDDLLSLAIKDYRKKVSKVTSFDTNILSNQKGTKISKFNTEL